MLFKDSHTGEKTIVSRRFLTVAVLKKRRKNMDYKASQAAFDVVKWLESDKKGKDFCGSYEFCAYCVKSEEYPCAKAMERCALTKTEKTYFRLARLVPVKE